MPTFRFKATNDAGGVVEGKVVEANAGRARVRLTRKYPELRDITVERDRFGLLQELDNALRPVPRTEVATFFKQLWLMFKAGIQLNQAVRILQPGYTSVRFKETLTEVERGIDEGRSLSDMMGLHPRVFPVECVGLVKVGEVTGSIQDVLGFCAQLLEEEDRRIRRVKSALTYPIVVLVVAIAICVALLLFFVPRMGAVLDMVPGELSLPTKILLGTSAALNEPLVSLSILVVGALLLFEIWARSRTPEGRAWWDRTLLKLPFTRPVILCLCLSRIAFALHMMISCGLGLVEALKLLKTGVPNEVVAESLSRVQDRIIDGQGLGEAMKVEPELNEGMFVPMVTVGEEASSLDLMMTYVHRMYSEELEHRLDTMTALVEPAVMAFMGVIVAGMVVTFMLPLVKLVQTL